MKTLFKKENFKKTILTFCYILLGILFCVLLSKMFNFVEYVLCYILLVAGIVCIIIYSLMSVDDKSFGMLAFGIIAVVIGFFMLLWPRFFGIALSAIICYSGVSLIISALKQRQRKEQGWVTEFVIGIIVTTLALVTAILSGTNVAKNILSIFIGVMLLINGGFELVELIKIVKNEKNHSKETGEVIVNSDNSIEVKDFEISSNDKQEDKG